MLNFVRRQEDIIACTIEGPDVPTGEPDLEGTTAASRSCDLAMFIDLTGRELYSYSLETVIELLHGLKRKRARLQETKLPFKM
jgi:hypothetical protein